MRKNLVIALALASTFLALTPPAHADYWHHGHRYHHRKWVKTWHWDHHHHRVWTGYWRYW